MRQYRSLRQLAALVLITVMVLAAAFVSEASSASKKAAPLSLHMDMNSRHLSIYDGYTSYVMGYRASEDDSFTVTKDSNGINLDDVTMNYYLITYDGDTQKYLECTVNGLKEGEHYPVVRPETVYRERQSGELYDTLERCYVVELCYEDTRSLYYFNLFPEESMREYRNLLLGKWKQEAKGWKYLYQDEYLISWAQINSRWYLFGTDGYMKTGWQEFDGQWYYLDPSTGVMQSNCTIDGYQLNGSGAMVSL